MENKIHVSNKEITLTMSEIPTRYAVSNIQFMRLCAFVYFPFIVKISTVLDRDFRDHVFPNRGETYRNISRPAFGQ